MMIFFYVQLIRTKKMYKLEHDKVKELATSTHKFPWLNGNPKPKQRFIFAWQYNGEGLIVNPDKRVLIRKQGE